MSTLTNSMSKIDTQEKIKKLKEMLNRVRKGTPAYRSLEQTLTELLEQKGAEELTSVKEEGKPEEEKQTLTSMFQAIGVIKGRIESEPVTNDEGENKTLLWLVHQDKKYRIRADKKQFRKLRRQHQENPHQEFYFKVYPYLQFIPQMDPELRFQIRTWQEEPYKNIEEGKFILRGIWQFIPQYRRPLITVLRNWMDKKDRDALLARGLDFKGNHVPVLWKNSPVQPFRFNPKAKAQGKRYFVEMRAKFISKLDTFGFEELIAEPTTQFPRYLLSQATLARRAQNKQQRKVA